MINVVSFVEKIAGLQNGEKAVGAFCKCQDGFAAISASLEYLSGVMIEGDGGGGEGKRKGVGLLGREFGFGDVGDEVEAGEVFERLLKGVAGVLRMGRKDAVHVVVFGSAFLRCLAQSVERLESSGGRDGREDGSLLFTSGMLRFAADIVGTLASIEDRHAAKVIASGAPEAIMFVVRRRKSSRGRGIGAGLFYQGHSKQLSEEEKNERIAFLRMRAALGIDPPRTLQGGFITRRGIRILSVDGGGTRGLMAIEVLKRLEKLTNRRISEMFDLIAGTSTGGVLTIGAGLAGRSLEECERLYRQFGDDIFTSRKQSAAAAVVSAGKLLFLNRGQYDTGALEQAFKVHAGSSKMIDTRHQDLSTDPPRVFVVSTLIRSATDSVASPKPYLHCNYRPPPYRESNQAHRYIHGCHHSLWESLRATTAAPSYFDPLNVGGDVFVDGAMLVNNPAAISVHEARLLWPGAPLDLIVSVGTGRFSDVNPNAEIAGVGRKYRGVNGGNVDTNSMLLGVARAVIDSATDVEAVHHALEDLAPDGVYYRFNARMMGPPIALDDARVERMDAMQKAAKNYVAPGGEGDAALRRVAKILGKSSGGAKRWWIPSSRL